MTEAAPPTHDVDTSPAAPQRVALRPAEAAKAMGISRRLVAQLLAERGPGAMPRCRIGRAVVIPTDELRRWLSERTEPQQKGPTP